MKTLRLKNVKAFKDSGDVEFKKISIFVGRNSCGKSSFIRFLAVLAQTVDSIADSPLVFNGKMVDYGRYTDVVYKHSVDDNITFELEYIFNENIRGLSPFFRHIMKRFSFLNGKSLRISTTVSNRKKRIIINNIELFISNEKICNINYKGNNSYSFSLYRDIKDDKITKFEYSIDITSERTMLFFPDIDQLTIINSVYKKENADELSRKDLIELAYYQEGDKLDSEAKYIRNIYDKFLNIYYVLEYLSHRVIEEIRMIKYIGPFRDNPSRIYRDPEYRSRSVGVHGENANIFLVHDYMNSKKIMELVSGWLHESMGYTLDVKDIGNGMFQIILKDHNGLESNIIDTGYGISQVLPIVIQIFYSTVKYSSNIKNNVDDIIVLEQPELHLHPAAQSSLATLFAECVLQTKNSLKIICETHSEHLIRKLQVLVADEHNGLTNDMVGIYYVDKNDEGEAVITEMKIDKNGKFINKWPSGFFDEAYNLSMELLKKSGKKHD